jgi:N-acetylmuramoyl-L-alanine amidase
MKKALILPLLFLFLASYSDASRLSSVSGFRTKSYKNYTRIVIDMDSSVEYTQNRLAMPDRLYFDLKKCMLPKKAVSSIKIDDGILKAVRMAQFDKNTVRVVLESHKVQNFYAFMLENPYRLVIDVYDQKNAEPAYNQRNKDIESDIGKIKKIVIDPGHGGDDPGAIGPSGIQEKDIVLSVGEKLGDILTAKYEAEVIFTRDKDIFIPLNERTEIANSNKADLFISIHANASPRKNTRGIETYFLNWTDDEEAMKVAARENKISFGKMKRTRGDLQFILQDLERKIKNEESMKLASSIQNAMVSALKEDYSSIQDLGVKYAMFYVLVGAEMPSILVEISFISNHEEEKRLTEEQYKDKIAEAIASGINSYITQSTLIVKKMNKDI